jgi:hypothetical protein
MSGKLKAYLRKAGARAFDAPIEAMGLGLHAVTPGDIIGWLESCGYRHTQA